ncbi:TMEM43 family protein [Alicyclobacillus fastidiosus]|uniref:TMEM43 family protein n=1 Tax=Alicyclobacillus fastidiosus TaxID=392011 RepID=A0ABY6ZAR2_9BACL|nr:hypothetical protein [Alicyclobacillus fastidiosus]WAH39618.1 TMEM43 family protein [Alicyclobacillus fastidiosus]GMA60825.1 hypothetical protein GCM10025859_12650 [Alicyclobacillus fastidiosus]
MKHIYEIVQVLVLYVTVLLGVLLYVAVLRHKEAPDDGDISQNRRARNLTLSLLGVITMIFGVGCLHEIWPQNDGLWLPILGILIIAVAWILYRLRKLSPNTN